jgi:hypothetical protein
MDDRDAQHNPEGESDNGH